MGILAILSCKNTYETAIAPPDAALVAKKGAGRANPCTDWASYLPDPKHPEYMPVRLIRVNFHVMNSADSTHNFRASEARPFLRQLLEVANMRMDTNIRNWRSPDGTPILPKNYRYVLCPQPKSNDDGIYFHYNDQDYYFVSSGKYQNNYDYDLIRKYGIGLDSIFNIFIQVHPDDSIKSKTYRANWQGIALTNGLKMAGIYETKHQASAYVGLMNHEIGHLLNLDHAWSYDGCPDTEDHPNRCWDYTPTPPCNTQATNNMMDYNAYQEALTPCQIGKVHAGFSAEKNHTRKYIVPKWCQRNPAMDVIIQDSVLWSGARDLEGNLTIAPTGSLRITCRLSMPEGSKITVQPGGKLWLDGAKIHNACGLPWKGIFAQKNKDGLSGKIMGENWTLELSRK